MASESEGFIGPYVKAERVEKAIADDLAVLAAHPVRQSKRRTQSWSAGADFGSAVVSRWPHTPEG
jgi:hypothetical protein